MRKAHRFITIFFLIVPITGQAASSPYENEIKEIPKKPSTPPALTQKSPADIPHCERFFVYQGRKLECDSNLGRDAERLRGIMQDVPQAIAELDTYQANREKIKIAAYLGTAGIVAILAGFVVGRPNLPFDPVSGAPRLGGIVILGGLGLSANALIYGLSVGKTNEGHLGNAVQYYNSAHPDRPIELKFSTEVNF